MRRDREPMRAVDLGGRVPPHDPGAEAAAIVAMLSRGGQVIDEVRDLLPADAFYSSSNASIVRACYALRDAGDDVDVQTVAGWLHARDWLADVGGVSGLARLCDATPAIVNPRHYARTVSELAKVRELIEEAQLVAAQGYGDYGEVGAFLEESAARIARVADTMPERRETLVSFGDVMSRRHAELREIWEGKREASGLPIPLQSVHRMFDGHPLGRVVIVSGATGSGKTVYAQQFAEHVAGGAYDGAISCVAYLSLEMTPEQLADRTYVRHAKVRLRALKSRPCTLTIDEVARVDWVRRTMGARPLFCTFHDLTITSLRAAIRRAHLAAAQLTRSTGKVHLLRLVVVDHLHIFDLEGASEDVRASQAAKLGELVRALKRIAVNDALCMMVLAQLNRDAAKSGGRPQVWQIKDASAIEQIADQIVLIHRPVLGFEDKKSAAAREVERLAEIIGAKTRDDQNGSCAVEFDGPYSAFREVA